jgi:hypothetical protein
MYSFTSYKRCALRQVTDIWVCPQLRIFITVRRVTILQPQQQHDNFCSPYLIGNFSYTPEKRKGYVSVFPWQDTTLPFMLYTCNLLPQRVFNSILTIKSVSFLNVRRLKTTTFQIMTQDNLVDIYWHFAVNRDCIFNARCSQTLVNFYQTSRCLIPEEGDLWRHRRDITKSRINQQIL